MAKLLKERARAPLADTPSVHASLGSLGYYLTLHQRDRAHTYDVVLSREEMLAVVASWLGLEARKAADEAKRKAAQS